MMSPASVYRIFKRPDGTTASVRGIVLVLIAIAALAMSIAVVRVTRQHEVLRLGLKLSKQSDHVRKLREAKRQLELEHATLTAPERIRRLALQLGMTSVAPTLEMKTSFFRPAMPGPLRGVGRVVRWGKTVAFTEGELYDAEGRLLAKATGTAIPTPFERYKK